MRPTNLKQWGGWVAHVYKAIALQHHTELRPIFAPYIPEDAVVIDVGAHAGQFAKLFARMAPQGRVYAFEPSAYARSILEPAIAWNWVNNVSIVPFGLSDTPDSKTLATPIKRRGGLGFGTAHLGEEPGEDAVSQTVELTTLDAFAEQHGLSRVDFIKMDIEGWELNALRGGIKTLTRFKPVIYLEVDEATLKRAGAAPSELWDLLAPLGYRAVKAPELDPVDGYDGRGDYLWRAD